MLRRALYSKTLRVSFILIEYSSRADSKRLPCIGTPGIETHRVDMRSFNQYRHTPLTASNFGMVIGVRTYSYQNQDAPRSRSSESTRARPQLGSCCFGDFLAANSTGTKRFAGSSKG